MSERAEELHRRLVSGDRRALAQAITLAESDHPDHEAEAVELLTRSFDATRPFSLRVGLTGPPGVGKSTLIDSWGDSLVEQGHRPAVLAIDPSSPASGGSLLGDRTRMSKLVRHAEAMVRPSPTRGHSGGTSEATAAVITLCEAAGFGPILVETVGVGQNEREVADLVDVVVLLLQPGAGDELQGLKRGLLESSDLVAVGQADGGRLPLAEETQRRFDGAARLMGARSPVTLVSSETGLGVAELWAAVEGFVAQAQETGAFEARRQRQRVHWFRRELRRAVGRRLERELGPSDVMSDREREVASGRRCPAEVALELIRAQR